MATGIEMMLKSMGIDPAAMLGQAEQIGKAVTQIHEALQRIEGKIDALNARLDTLADDDTAPAPVSAEPKALPNPNRVEI